MCVRNGTRKNTNWKKRYSDYISVASFGYILLALSDSILFRELELAHCSLASLLLPVSMSYRMWYFSGIIFHIHIYISNWLPASQFYNGVTFDDTIQVFLSLSPSIYTYHMKTHSARIIFEWIIQMVRKCCWFGCCWLMLRLLLRNILCIPERFDDEEIRCDAKATLIAYTRKCVRFMWCANIIFAKIGSTRYFFFANCSFILCFMKMSNTQPPWIWNQNALCETCWVSLHAHEFNKILLDFGIFVSWLLFYNFAVQTNILIFGR